jgi:hypothetical protein
MASFLDTLFGGGAEQEAADKNRALLSQYGQTGNAALDTGLGQQTGALNTGAGNAAGLLGQNTGLYSGLLGTGTNTLNQGLQSSLGALGQAGGAYAPLSALAGKYGAGTDMYMNSLGLNGAAGNQAAVNAFQTGPGYDFQMNQGLDAINRQRAASGMLNSGNTSVDALKYGQGLANQAYGGWQSQLQGLISPELQATQGAATGQATADTNMANMYNQNALAQLGLQTGVTQGQAGVNTNLANNQSALGNALSGVYGTDASNRVALQGGITSGGMSANNTQAAGEAAGAKNLLGAGLSLASLVAGGPIGGALGGGLTSMFGGGASGAANTGMPGSSFQGPVAPSTSSSFLSSLFR